MDKIQKSKSEKIRIKNIATWILYIAMTILFVICLTGIILSLVYYFNFNNDNTLIGATATFSVGLLAASIQFTIVIKSGKASKDKNITRTINLYNSYSEKFILAERFNNILIDTDLSQQNIENLNINYNTFNKYLCYVAQVLKDKNLISIKKTKTISSMIEHAHIYFKQFDNLLCTLISWRDSGQIDAKMFDNLFANKISIIENIIITYKKWEKFQ